jgi:hypothetical protein
VRPVYSLFYFVFYRHNFQYFKQDASTIEFSDFYLSYRIKVFVRKLEGEHILVGENSNRISSKAMATKRGSIPDGIIRIFH